MAIYLVGVLVGCIFFLLVGLRCLYQSATTEKYIEIV